MSKFNLSKLCAIITCNRCSPRTFVLVFSHDRWSQIIMTGNPSAPQALTDSSTSLVFGGSRLSYERCTDLVSLGSLVLVVLNITTIKSLSKSPINFVNTAESPLQCCRFPCTASIFLCYIFLYEIKLYIGGTRIRFNLFPFNPGSLYKNTMKLPHKLRKYWRIPLRVL